MASKPKVANRTTTRTKPGETAGPARTVRGTTQRSAPTPSLADAATKKGAARKPFVDRNNSPEGKPRDGAAGSGLTKSQGKATAPKSTNVMMMDDFEREPIRVRYTLCE